MEFRCFVILFALLLIQLIHQQYVGNLFGMNQAQCHQKQYEMRQRLKSEKKQKKYDCVELALTNRLNFTVCAIATTITSIRWWFMTPNRRLNDRICDAFFVARNASAFPSIFFPWISLFAESNASTLGHNSICCSDAQQNVFGLMQVLLHTHTHTMWWNVREIDWTCSASVVQCEIIVIKVVLLHTICTMPRRIVRIRCVSCPDTWHRHKLFRITTNGFRCDSVFGETMHCYQHCPPECGQWRGPISDYRIHLLKRKRKNTATKSHWIKKFIAFALNQNCDSPSVAAATSVKL